MTELVTVDTLTCANIGAVLLHAELNQLHTLQQICKRALRRTRKGDRNLGALREVAKAYNKMRASGLPGPRTPLAMTQFAAWKKAHSLWSRTRVDDPGIGDRLAATRLRRKSVTDRCEVGYIELTIDDGKRGVRVVLGAGPTWEAAFEEAARRREEQEREESRL